MKLYKDFEKQYIGTSDIARLILAGFKNEIGFKTTELCFGGDNSYEAYVVYGSETIIPTNYRIVAEFNTWMKIYDDKELVKKFNSNRIIIYRSGEMGCIIQLID